MALDVPIRELAELGSRALCAGDIKLVCDALIQEIAQSDFLLLDIRSICNSLNEFRLLCERLARGLGNPMVQNEQGDICIEVYDRQIGRIEEGVVLRDQVVLFALLASLGRSGLILGINETAQSEAGEYWPLVLLAVAAVVFLVASYLARVRSHMIVVQLKARLRQRFSALLLAANVDFLQRNDHGEVYSAVTREVSELSGAVVNLIEAVEAFLLLAICVPYLFWISRTAGAATFLQASRVFL